MTSPTVATTAGILVRCQNGKSPFRPTLRRTTTPNRTAIKKFLAWQLIINTGTTVVTFLVVFLIQNTQNRYARAIHLKLDEIIESIDQAQKEMIDIEHLSDDELQRLSDKYQKVREECDTGAIVGRRKLRRKFDQTKADRLKAAGPQVTSP
jgi:low affinity Fe/Cu permease